MTEQLPQHQVVDVQPLQSIEQKENYRESNSTCKIAELWVDFT